MIDFFRVLERVHIERANDAENKERAIRMFGGGNESWCIQVRAPISRADGSEGKEFMLATAWCSFDELRGLRGTIDEVLAEAPQPAPPAEKVKAPIAKAHAPTLLGLAAVADASGLGMLADTFCKAHDEAAGLFERVTAVSVKRALQVVAEAEKVWQDAAESERAFSMGDRGEPAARIDKALRLLAVARKILGG